MLKAYIDDSHMNQPPVYLLAGWIAPAHQWVRFSNAWREALLMKPSVEYFKFSDAMNFNGPFNGISEQSRNQKVALLVRTIQEHSLLGISTTIPSSVFLGLFGPGCPAIALRNPYFLAFFDIISRAISYYDSSGTTEKIEFVFDDQPGQEEVVLEAWNLFLDTAPDRFKRLLGGPPIFQSDRDVVALQAADLHAGWLHKLDEAAILKRDPPEPLWGRAGDEIQRIYRVFTPELAEAMFERVFGYRPLRVTMTFGYGISEPLE